MGKTKKFCKLNLVARNKHLGLWDLFPLELNTDRDLGSFNVQTEGVLHKTKRTSYTKLIEGPLMVLATSGEGTASYNALMKERNEG